MLNQGAKIVECFSNAWQNATLGARVDGNGRLSDPSQPKSNRLQQESQIAEQIMHVSRGREMGPTKAAEDAEARVNISAINRNGAIIESYFCSYAIAVTCDSMPGRYSCSPASSLIFRTNRGRGSDSGSRFETKRG